MVDDAVNHAAFGRLATVAIAQLHLHRPEDPRREHPRAVAATATTSASSSSTDLFGRVPNPTGAHHGVLQGAVELRRRAGRREQHRHRARRHRAQRLSRGHRPALPRAHPLRRRHDSRSSSGFREGLANIGRRLPLRGAGPEGRLLHAFQAQPRGLPRGLPEPRPRVLAHPVLRPQRGLLPPLPRQATRKAPWGHDWKPYRRFFRAYREAPAARRARAVRRACLRLVPDAGLRRRGFRRPARASAGRCWRATASAVASRGRGVRARASSACRCTRNELRDFPNSPLPRDLLGRELLRQPGLGARGHVAASARIVWGSSTTGGSSAPSRARAPIRVSSSSRPSTRSTSRRSTSAGSNICKWRSRGRDSPGRAASIARGLGRPSTSRTRTTPPPTRSATSRSTGTSRPSRTSAATTTSGSG